MLSDLSRLEYIVLSPTTVYKIPGLDILLSFELNMTFFTAICMLYRILKLFLDSDLVNLLHWYQIVS